MASIQGIYIALFGRPADPAGLAFFNAATGNGADLSAIGDLAATAEYQTRFAGKSNTQIITDIYQALFGRAPDAAGLAFFVDALNKGTQTINTIAINIFDGAQGDDKALLDKKVAAAELFTAELDTPVEIGNYTGTAAAAKGAAFITAVTAASPVVDAAAAAAAVADIPNTGGSAGVAGVSITIANAATDSVSPTAANPALKSTAGDDTITAAAGNFTTNSVEGGDGKDALNITEAGAVAMVASKLAGVETVTYTQSAATAGSFALTNATGVELVNVKGSATASTVTISDFAGSTKAGVEGTGGTVVFALKDATGSSDALTIVSKAATLTTGLTLTGIETANVELSGTSNLGTITNAASTLETLKATGTGDLTVVGSSTLKTVDLSGISGGGTVDTQLNITGATFTGGKGIDTVTFAGAAAKDTIVYTKDNLSTKSSADSYTNFVSGEDKIDLKALSLAASKVLALTTFNAAPVEGASFGTNAVAVDTTTNTVYIDTNDNGKVDLATDAAFIAGVSPVLGDFIFS